MSKPILVGAVLYDPKVSVIWDIIRDFFDENGCPIDVVFYTNYELQVKSLAEGHVDIAWNSPLAWLDTVRQTSGACRAIAMRDTDQDRVTHWVVKKGSEIKSLADLKGKTVAVGANDSPQAKLIPLGMLQTEGLDLNTDLKVNRFDVLVGKHGDHIGGELDAFKCLQAGEAAASAMLDLNWNAWTADGTIDPTQFEILATTDQFDHCVFAVKEDFPADIEKRWLEVLFSMSYDNPLHREMMDMEGLKEWKQGRSTGFDALSAAVAGQNFFANSVG